jgi:hypothetical protein
MRDKRLGSLCIYLFTPSVYKAVPSYTYTGLTVWLTTYKLSSAILILPQHRIEPGSSVSIVSGYGLDDRAIQVRSPAEAKDLSSNVCVQTGSGAHPASCTMGTGESFPGGKARPGRVADHSPQSSAEDVNE